MTQQGGGDLPYTPLDHCYFDDNPVSLGFKFTTTVTLLKASFTALNSNWILGAREYQTSNERFQLQASASGNGVITNNISATTTTNISSLSKRIDYSYDGSTVTIENNGNTYTSTDIRGFPNGSRIVVLGAIRNGANILSGSHLVGYFWGLEIEINNALAYKFIPVKDTDNVVCIYETVNQTFHYPTSGTLVEDP
jgi:hypothetical protein